MLIISGNQRLRDELTAALQRYEDYVVAVVPHGRQGLERARADRSDLVLLDVELPDMNGYEACKLLRRTGNKKPIIMVSESAQDSDVILGLEFGANDFVSTPLHAGVLMARIRAHLRQHEQSEAAEVFLGPYLFKPHARLLVDAIRNSKIRLTETETSLLRFMHEHNGKPVTQKELLIGVWGYSTKAHTHTVTTHIYRLRQKIEADPAVPSLLCTTRDGYCLAAGPAPRRARNFAS